MAFNRVINEEKDNFPKNPSLLVENPADQDSIIGSCQKALNNSVVLRTIMSNLRTKDLLAMRLVSKNWEEEATIQLLSRCRKTQQKGYYDEVKFYWKDDQREFRNKVGTLQDFTNSCCSNPLRKFPCSQFFFNLETKVAKIEEAAGDLSKFFAKNGDHITSLYLKSSRNSARAFELFRKIIFEWAPNLKFLFLEVNLYPNKIEPPTLNDTVDLPKLVLKPLKKVTCYPRCYCDPPKMISDDEPLDLTGFARLRLFFKEILSSAPNLTDISDPALLYTEEIVVTGKILRVPRYECCCYDEGWVSRFDDFCRARPQLTFLKLLGASNNNDDHDHDHDEIGPLKNFLPSLELIFQSSQKTLKKLFLSGRLDGPDDKSGRTIRIPIMENLEDFYIYNWSQAVGGGQGRILPPGYNVQDFFPRLKKLRLRGVEEEDEEDNPFNKRGNSSTTVQHLAIDSMDEPDSFFNLGWLSQALALYPNVRSLDLTVPNFHEFPEICRTIWEAWRESWLEELSICAFFNQDNEDDDDHDEDNANLAKNMDQVLTGFDQELCKFLRNKRGSEHNLQVIEEGEFKRGPSILDMKRLKLFKLSYADDLPFFSRVAVIHAFEPMKRRQGLKVFIDDVDLDERMDEFEFDDVDL